MQIDQKTDKKKTLSKSKEKLKKLVIQVKEDFMKTTEKYLCQSLSLDKVSVLLWHKYFPVNLPKMLGSPPVATFFRYYQT